MAGLNKGPAKTQTRQGNHPIPESPRFLFSFNQEERLVYALISRCVPLNGVYLQVSPLVVPITRVTVSGVPPFIPDCLLCGKADGDRRKKRASQAAQSRLRSVGFINEEMTSDHELTGDPETGKGQEVATETHSHLAALRHRGKRPPVECLRDSGS
ncbi:hypothetical protein EYF80_054020 [Liparis tanakae]|uniref:Uncharacterized protein n=1 Tax=Liparis tanakae TaxID=230148 RepID=A0A4Z2F4Z5_9TELE|nr:hypothetical protein EYF80_054020 [Liparis tanakae]